MSVTASGLVEVEKGELTNYSQYADGEWKRISSKLPDEMLLSLFVNGQELVSILCTPEKLNCLVIGYLRSDGFIDSLDDIAMMRICLDESLADVKLTHQLTASLPKRVLTSGCGGGISFETGVNIQQLNSSRRVSPSQILSSIRLLQRKSENQVENNGIRRGVHVSALSDGNKLITRAEDIGRHNTLDKIWGECMLRRIPTEDLLLLTTGRISSEMLIKAAKMGIPVVASLNSATNRAVKLGADLGITIVGYAHGSRLSVFSSEERLRVADN
ncbi:formate dehydrogenase accessory sulfurtransferase FdhD [Chloroflexota bacterium]